MSDKPGENIPPSDITFPAEEKVSGSSPFDTIRHVHENGQEYWSARELARVLGYGEWRFFKKVLQRAENACTQNGRNVADHFVQMHGMVGIGSGAKRQIEDVQLTRYACYLTADNADPSKPIVAQAQNYFITRARIDDVRDDLAALRDEQEKRLHLRERVSDVNKKLGEAAQDAGVPSKRFGIFQDAGYKGLYGGLGVEDIKAAKKIPAKDDVLDRMGREELAANEFRITQTEAKLRRDAIKGEKAATNAHHEIGRGVRKTIQQFGGTLPEDLPPEPTIKPLLDERKRKRKEIAPQQGQASLFDGSDNTGEQPDK